MFEYSMYYGYTHDGTEYYLNSLTHCMCYCNDWESMIYYCYCYFRINWASTAHLDDAGFCLSLSAMCLMSGIFSIAVVMEIVTGSYAMYLLMIKYAVLESTSVALGCLLTGNYGDQGTCSPFLTMSKSGTIEYELTPLSSVLLVVDLIYHCLPSCLCCFLLSSLSNHFYEKQSIIVSSIQWLHFTSYFWPLQPTPA